MSALIFVITLHTTICYNVTFDNMKDQMLIALETKTIDFGKIDKL